MHPIVWVDCDFSTRRRTVYNAKGLLKEDTCQEAQNVDVFMFLIVGQMLILFKWNMGNVICERCEPCDG